MFCFFDVAQLGYLAYFGNGLTPFVISLLFDMENFKDVAKSSFGDVWRFYPMFISVGIPYFLSFYMVKKYNDRLYKVKYAWILLFVILAHFPYRAYHSYTVARIMASYERPSLYNGWKVATSYLFNILPKGQAVNTSYKDYDIKKFKPRDVNIILIYGESLNWHNSSLFGYANKTMPQLEQFAKDNPNNFKYSKAISCAIFTASSIPCFFNYVREPDNFKQHQYKKSNLFKLAKENNFNTYWISVQSTSLINNLSPQYMDKIHHYNTDKKIIDALEDEALLEILKQYDVNDGNNFIVLHKSNLHSPHKQYQLNHKEFGVFEMEYDNSMLYEDYLLKNIFDYVKANFHKTFYVFLISDHGSIQENMQSSAHGHGILNNLAADVPAMIYTNDTDKTILNKFEKIHTPTAHQFADLIVELMGYKITTPNTPDNVYYVNGTDMLGRHGWLKVIKDEKNKKFSFERK
ncbi:MAG: sulfatase-like hydrolase/transferase [Rickettsiales bacterium]|nr:sulfatase-like hydrolase/transferase [Rickettsiales bacterium]